MKSCFTKDVPLKKKKNKYEFLTNIFPYQLYIDAK